MLDVRRMRVLREVATQGSFSAAAEALAYTQSAVSQQIAALEREAGTLLVDRSARGVRMTDAGRALVAHADVILARLQDAEAELGAIAGLRGGRLRMSTFASAGATVVPRAIAAFRERHPGVELTLEPEEPNDDLRLLREGTTDLAITLTWAFAPAAPADIAFTHLVDDPMHVLLPAGHRLAECSRVSLADLAQDPWILGATGRCPDTALLVRACSEAGFEPQIAFHSDDYLAIQGFVAAGFGVSMIPDLALVAVRDDVVVKSLGAEPPVRQIKAATLAGSWASPAKAAMVAVLLEVAQDFTSGRQPLALAG